MSQSIHTFAKSEPSHVFIAGDGDGRGGEREEEEGGGAKVRLSLSEGELYRDTLEHGVLSYVPHTQ